MEELQNSKAIYNYNENKFMFTSNFTTSDQNVVRTDNRKICWTVTVSPVLCIFSPQISMLSIGLVLLPR